MVKQVAAIFRTRKKNTNALRKQELSAQSDFTVRKL